MERRDLDVPSETYRAYGTTAPRSDRASIGAEPDEDPLLGLLERWQQRYVCNEDPTPEELGVEDPLLRESLREQIRDHKRLFGLLGLPLDPSGEERADFGHAVGPTGAGPVNQTVTGSVPRIGRYQVLGTLGRGGQADVFRVLHPELSREFVLKLARRCAAVNPDDRDRMLREGQLLAACDHPNLVRVTDLDFHEGRPFVVMEQVHGLNLEQFADQRRPTYHEIARLVADLCRAVTYVHRRGALHLDIKAKNVLIDEVGQPRLIDFGLARLRHAWAEDPAGSSGGTTCYMSPEQARGDEDRIGPWTDVFGLGGVLYYLLTGRPVYEGTSTLDALQLAMRGEQIPPRRSNRGVSRRLERIGMKALAPDSGRRYRSAEELEQALRGFLRRPWLMAVGAAVLGSAAVASLALRHGPARKESSSSPSRVASAPAFPIAAEVVPRIVSFDVKHYRGDNPPKFLGTIGVSAGPIHFDDDARIHIQLSAPAYCYLFALNPDSKVQLFYPPKPAEAPPRSKDIDYPPGDLYFPLTDGTGLQAFVLLVSRKPLPAFAEWEGRKGLLRFSQVPPDLLDAHGKRWVTGHSDGAGVWGFDGHAFEPLVADRRGEPRKRSGVPAPFKEVCEYVVAMPGVDVVRAIAFPVFKPKGRDAPDLGR